MHIAKPERQTIVKSNRIAKTDLIAIIVLDAD